MNMTSNKMRAPKRKLRISRKNDYQWKNEDDPKNEFHEFLYNKDKKRGQTPKMKTFPK